MSDGLESPWLLPNSAASEPGAVVRPAMDDGPAAPGARVPRKERHE